MVRTIKFEYEPGEHEAEKASTSYVMSLVAMIAGLPLPIINLLATFVFFLGNKNGTYFVRWHCMHALLSQFSLFLINTCSFWWTIKIIFTPTTISNEYIAYMITVLIYNFAELIVTIYTSIQTRKGNHVEWWFFGNVTNIICKP